MVTNLCYSLFLVHLENSVLFIERLNPIMVLSSEITKEEGFTLAGVLMFGKEDAITDTECCPNFFPDYREKLLDNPEIRWTNRICPDGTWEANLFQFYLRVLPRLCAVLPKPFILKDNIRRDETPAHIAVREALVNLCIHTDYSADATMVVRLFPNKMVFLI